LGTDVPLILDGGPCAVGLESTVLDLTSDSPRILRPGIITVDALKAVIGKITPYSRGENERGSPGLKHIHYAPKLKMILVPPHAWETLMNPWRLLGKRLGVISLHHSIPSQGLLYCKKMRDMNDYAQNLFAALHEAEEANVEILFVETVPKEGVGVAIMDRLERGAGRPALP